MKKATFLSLLTLVLALPLLAEDEPDRHQSYLSYDDGGTIVRSGEDGSEIEAHRNLPIYPGDEIVTARRGRAEVRLSDGNIIGVDRATALRFRSILDSYEGERGETVVLLKYGKVAVHRTDLGEDHVRLDTDNASYVASDEAVYSVETDSKGRDRVTVFDGALEVRTRTRSMRVREGESITVDAGGVFDLTGDQRNAADDFEKWFLKRAERFGSYNSRHMDRRLSYWSDDLDENGTWVYVSGIGYSWRPYVAAGWRPYYNGYWSNRYGCLTWVSHDPWGWGTYHYGRWAFDPGFGWVWVPGHGYSPAWVYWMYGSGTIGWAPAGWWDCHRSYYNWAYNPYRNHGDYGFGFYGRVRLNDLDMRPWTFIDSRTIISTRVDRAALTADAVKQRLGRSRDGFTTVARGPARFTREEWNDPAEVIRRRGIGNVQTGRETGAPPTDMTPFFRRDGDVAGEVRDRIVRARGTAKPGFTPSGVPSRTVGGGSAGSLAPIGTGSVAPIGRGSVSPIGTRRNTGDTPAAPAPVAQPSTDSGSGSSSTGRGHGIDRRRDSGTPRDGETPRSAPVWRERPRSGGDASPSTAPAAPSSTPTPAAEPERGGKESWRGRVRRDDGPADVTRSTTPAPSSSTGSDVPRRVINGINGPRISRDRDNSGSRSSGSSTSSDTSRRDRGSSARESSGSRDSGSRDRGSSSRESASPRSEPRSEPRTESKPSSSDSQRSSRGDSGGKVKRD